MGKLFWLRIEKKKKNIKAIHIYYDEYKESRDTD